TGLDRRRRSTRLRPAAPARRCTCACKPSVGQLVPSAIRKVVGRDQSEPDWQLAPCERQQTPNAQRPTLNIQFIKKRYHRWPTKYRSGNKKTQTISTKCQYRPAISTVFCFP